MIDPASSLEVSDTNGSHSDLVLEALQVEQARIIYTFDFGSTT